MKLDCGTRDWRSRARRPPLLNDAELWRTRTLFALCRRHSLAFSVIALRVGGPEGVGRRPGGGTRDAWARLGPRIAPELRDTDQVLRLDPGRHAVVFCPDTPAQGTKVLAERLEKSAGDIPLRFGMACFREDALTLGDLIETALSRIDDEKGRPRARARRAPEAFRRPSGAGPGAAWRHRLRRFAKRASDLAIVCGTAPIWLPLLLFAALAVKLSHPTWPVFFVQPRTGRGGERFGMFKLRTMVPDAEERKAELAHRNQLQWPDFKLEEDPRVTRVGRWLRKTSLDELPQVLNVLRGDMSLVGPRPTSFHPDTYEDWQTARLDVQPGLTGLWQVEARSSIEFDERLRLDIEYIERQGFFYDLWILCRTVLAVARMRGSR